MFNYLFLSEGAGSNPAGVVVFFGAGTIFGANVGQGLNLVEKGGCFY